MEPGAAVATGGWPGSRRPSWPHAALRTSGGRRDGVLQCTGGDPGGNGRARGRAVRYPQLMAGGSWVEYPAGNEHVNGGSVYPKFMSH